MNSVALLYITKTKTLSHRSNSVTPCERQVLTKRKFTACRYGIDKLAPYVDLRGKKKYNYQLEIRNGGLQI